MLCTSFKHAVRDTAINSQIGFLFSSLFECKHVMRFFVIFQSISIFLFYPLAGSIQSMDDSPLTSSQYCTAGQLQGAPIEE